MRRRARAEHDDEAANWQYPEVGFEPRIAEQIVRAFPVEAFCQSNDHQRLFLIYLHRFWPGPTLVSIQAAASRNKSAATASALTSIYGRAG